MTHFNLFECLFTAIMVSTASVQSISPCNYIQPNISAASGPLELLILMAGYPQKVIFPEKGETFLYNGYDRCYSGSQSLGCESNCTNLMSYDGGTLCWFKLKLRDATGLNAIYFTSLEHTLENIQGIYRPQTEYDINNYFLESSGAVTCTTKKKAKFSWSIANPNKVGSKLRCFFQGNPLLNDTATNKQEINLLREKQRFETVICGLKHNDVWMYSSRFVFWQDPSKFVLRDTDIEDQKGKLKNSTYFLVWSVETLESPFNQSFRCVSNSRPICSGVTITKEPGKCQIELNQLGFQFTYLWNATVGHAGAFYCYLDNTVLAKSVYIYETDEDQIVLETLIWQRLLKAYVSLNNFGSQILQITGLNITDVSCATMNEDNEYACSIAPPNMKLQWIVKINEIELVARVFQLNETVFFNGSFSQRPGYDRSFIITGPQYNLQMPIQPIFNQKNLDTVAIIRRILEENFSE